MLHHIPRKEPKHAERINKKKKVILPYCQDVLKHLSACSFSFRSLAASVIRVDGVPWVVAMDKSGDWGSDCRAEECVSAVAVVVRARVFMRTVIRFGLMLVLVIRIGVMLLVVIRIGIMLVLVIRFGIMDMCC